MRKIAAAVFLSFCAQGAIVVHYLPYSVPIVIIELTKTGSATRRPNQYISI